MLCVCLHSINRWCNSNAQHLFDCIQLTFLMPAEQSLEQHPILTVMLSSVRQLMRFSTASSWHFWLTPLVCRVGCSSTSLSAAYMTHCTQTA